MSIPENPDCARTLFQLLTEIERCTGLIATPFLNTVIRSAWKFTNQDRGLQVEVFLMPVSVSDVGVELKVFKVSTEAWRCVAAWIAEPRTVATIVADFVRVWSEDLWSEDFRQHHSISVRSWTGRDHLDVIATAVTGLVDAK